MRVMIEDKKKRDVSAKELEKSAKELEKHEVVKKLCNS
jgi:hypothetical protein